MESLCSQSDQPNGQDQDKQLRDLEGCFGAGWGERVEGRNLCGKETNGRNC
jgi:hypothetical protein